MENEKLLEKAVAKGIIAFSEDNNFITYTCQNKRRSYQTPEEKVQALTFAKLVLEYNYPQEQIKQFVAVQMGASTK